MRYIPPALQAHLDQPVTTTCLLLLIRLADGREFGLTTLDRDVIYQGVTYSAARGFDPSIIATDTSLSVDNAEGYALLAGDVPGITIEMVETGQMDNATWQQLVVNWSDLSMGHATIDAGDVGKVTTKDGMVYMPELLSYVMRLRQAIGGVWSRTCRATFGSPANSQTGCGVDADALWVSGEVTALDDEPRRVFAGSTTGMDPAPIPGRVRITSGRNAGSRLYQVEAYSAVSGTIGLLEPLPFPLEVGDGYEIRIDCPKTPDACRAFNNYLNYKGEPGIPVGDGIEMLTPGADLPGGFSGSEVIDD